MRFMRPWEACGTAAGAARGPAASRTSRISSGSTCAAHRVNIRFEPAPSPMIDSDAERAQSLLDALERGVLTRRRFLELLRAAGLSAAVGSSAIAAASAAGSNQSIRRRSLKSGYDYIVVGAGAAGCIIAAALAGAGAEVLLLEAGGTDELPQVNTPGLWFTNIGTSLDWRFTAEPSPSVDERRVPIAMGHVLGGGTSINAMLWVRGLASDFDHWAGAGCAGWGFSDILPLYKRIEDWQGGANEGGR